MTDDRLVELCKARDKMIDQYKGTITCETCGHKVDRCTCQTPPAEWFNVALFILYGDQHLASVTVPTRIVAAQRAVLNEILGEGVNYDAVRTRGFHGSDTGGTKSASVQGDAGTTYTGGSEPDELRF